MRNTSDIRLRYRPFLVKYHGPGNVRGSRLTIHDLRHGTRRTIQYDDSKGRSEDQAWEHLESVGIKIVAMALPHEDARLLLLSEDFATPLK